MVRKKELIARIEYLELKSASNEKAIVRESEASKAVEYELQKAVESLAVNTDSNVKVLKSNTSRVSTRLGQMKRSIANTFYNIATTDGVDSMSNSELLKFISEEVTKKNEA